MAGEVGREVVSFSLIHFHSECSSGLRVTLAGCLMVAMKLNYTLSLSPCQDVQLVRRMQVYGCQRGCMEVKQNVRDRGSARKVVPKCCFLTIAHMLMYLALTEYSKNNAALGTTQQTLLPRDPGESASLKIPVLLELYFPSKPTNPRPMT